MNMQRGFSLMELMVVAVIVAILAAIAIPSYTQHVNRTRRTDAQAALLDVSQRLERCYTLYNRFDHADCPVALPETSPEGHYTITGTIAAGSYRLTAAPAPGSPQANDADCSTLTIDHLNRRGASGKNAAECW